MEHAAALCKLKITYPSRICDSSWYKLAPNSVSIEHFAGAVKYSTYVKDHTQPLCTEEGDSGNKAMVVHVLAQNENVALCLKGRFYANLPVLYGKIYARKVGKHIATLQ